MGVFRTPIDLKHCIVKMQDGIGGTGANSLTIRVGSGDFTWSEKHPIEYIRDRGKLDTVRKGEEMPCEVRLNITYVLLTQDGANPAEAITPADVLHHRNGAATWVSSAVDICEPFAINLSVEYDPACVGVKSEIALFPDFRYESLDYDVKAGTFNITGKCNATQPIVTRQAQSTNTAVTDI